MSRFKAEAPMRLRPIKVGKTRYFLPYEAYFPYWRGYILVEALTGYLDIERFLPRKRGVACLLDRISLVSNKWKNTYGDTFDRLSTYRTATSIIHSRYSKTDLTCYEISSFLLKKNGATAKTLETDLEKLLILFRKWHELIQRNGSPNLRQPLEFLRQDICHLFEWLCTTTGVGEMYYFEKWSYKNMCHNEWAQLQDVISYEKFELKNTFMRFIKYYCEDMQDFCYTNNIDETYKRLSELSSFSPWIRSFTDMHKSINRKGILDFRQPRILDNLIIMTTRTEIVIRSMFKQYLCKEDPSEMFKVFNELSAVVNNKSAVKILSCLHNDWANTKLNDKPKDIFSRIDAIPRKNGWSNESMHFYKQILRFVTARNYFAHHSYKDNDINNRNGLVAADVLKSCVQSLVYLDSVLC